MRVDIHCISHALQVHKSHTYHQKQFQANNKELHEVLLQLVSRLPAKKFMIPKIPNISLLSADGGIWPSLSIMGMIKITNYYLFLQTEYI